MDKDKKIVSEEVDDRLDAFFSDDDWAPAPEPPPKQSAPPQKAPVAAAPEEDDDDVITLEAAAPDSPMVEADKLGLGDLKVLVLSLDWEITDSIMEKMEEAARSLKARYNSDAVATTHLSLMELLGKYIRVKKADAHPDSVLLLREVYEGLENCLSRPGDETARKRAALALVERFNRIKKQIAAVKGVKPRAAESVDEGEIIEARPVSEEEDVITAQPVAMAPAAVNLAAVKEEIVAALKSHLDAELSAIRAEIREAREAVDRAVSQILAAVSALGGKTPPEDYSGEISASTALAGDVLDAEPLEAAIVEDSGEDDVIDSEPLEASAVQPRELPGSGDLAAEGDLALELGLSMEDDLGPGPDPKDDLELL